MKAVPSDKPFNLAPAPLVKPDPVIVTVTVGLPAGAEDGLTDVITGAGADGTVIAIEKFCAADDFPAESVAVTLKKKGLPVTVVGVPLITPVAWFSASPGGREPDNVQVYGGPTPPVAVSVCEYVVPVMPAGRDSVETVIAGATTVPPLDPTIRFQTSTEPSPVTGS